MPSTAQQVVRGRCLCGQRYRIRNASLGAGVTCPRCGRVITIALADLAAATAHAQGVGIVPLQPDAEAPLEAVLIDCGRLTLAPAGSRPGLTGRVVYSNDESLLLRARSGGPTGLGGARRTVASLAAGTGAGRTLGRDLLASLYFAGSGRNAAYVLITAMAFALLTLLEMAVGGRALSPLTWFLRLTLVLISLLAFLYLIHFFWSVLQQTAAGENELAWIETDWSLWEDACRPVLHLLIISAVCSAPAALVARMFPALPASPLVVGCTLAAGWCFWPAGVTLVAMTGTLRALRPDHLLRFIAGAGPGYLAALAGTGLLLASWLGRIGYADTLAEHVALAAAQVYLGYVLFRTLGLLALHSRWNPI